MLSLICAWINGWVNNDEARDLRRRRAPHDVTVMFRVDGLIDVHTTARIWAHIEYAIDELYPVSSLILSQWSDLRDI